MRHKYMNVPNATLLDSSMPNKTLYIHAKDVKTWDEAQRYLRFYRNKGLAEYITPLLEKYLAEEKAAQAAKKD